MTDATDTALLLERLYEWWVGPGGPRPDIFHPRLAYDGGVGDLKDEELLWWVEHKAPWNDLRVLHRAVDEGQGILTFDGIDGGTGLKHRVSWVVEFRDGKITRIAETVETQG